MVIAFEIGVESEEVCGEFMRKLITLQNGLDELGDVP